MVTTQNETNEITKNFNTDIFEKDFSDEVSEVSSVEGEENEDGLEICPSDVVGTFGNVVVKNSQDVHFGPKTFYQGPVTIKQFLYNNSISDTKLCVDEGHENPSSVGNGSTTTIESNGYFESNGGPVQNGGPVPNVEHPENFWSKLLNLSPRLKIAVLCSLVVILTMIILFSTYAVVKSISHKTFADRSRTDSDEQDYVEPIPVPRGNFFSIYEHFFTE